MKVLWGWRFDAPGITVCSSSIVTAFNYIVIGTKVTDDKAFWRHLRKAIMAHDFSKGKTPGQALLRLPKKACETVSCGVGRRTNDSEDYHPALHRDKVELFLHRSVAAKTKSLHVVVYTLEAYKKDPDVEAQEIVALSRWGTTHVIVAILASADNNTQLSPSAFVHNLAGGNNDYEPGKLTIRGLIRQAQAIEKYNSEWCTVADTDWR